MGLNASKTTARRQPLPTATVLAALMCRGPKAEPLPVNRWPVRLAWAKSLIRPIKTGAAGVRLVTRPSRPCLAAWAVVAITGAFATSPAAAGQLTTLFNFGADGATPKAGLTAVGGVLYGTTAGGGSAGAGTVFSYSAALGLRRPRKIGESADP